MNLPILSDLDKTINIAAHADGKGCSEGQASSIFLHAKDATSHGGGEGALCLPITLVG